ncbi:MAG: NUDIX domain-containing protein [Candidatus Competibacteraceae bacterium]
MATLTYPTLGQSAMQANFCPQCGNPLHIATLNGKLRQRCSIAACSYIHWDNPIPIVAAIVEVAGNVILARNRSWPEKMYGLITGFLEKGETPEAAVQREVREELALSADAAHFIGYYPFFEMNQLILAFHVPARGEITLGEELVEVKQVPVGRLKPWSFGTGYAVRDWLATRQATA